MHITHPPDGTFSQQMRKRHNLSCSSSKGRCEIWLCIGKCTARALPRRVGKNGATCCLTYVCFWHFQTLKTSDLMCACWMHSVREVLTRNGNSFGKYTHTRHTHTHGTYSDCQLVHSTRLGLIAKANIEPHTMVMNYVSTVVVGVNWGQLAAGIREWAAWNRISVWCCLMVTIAQGHAFSIVGCKQTFRVKIFAGALSLSRLNGSFGMKH